jgi:23S rRNA (cytidine2498-2'-O)-methyltransferase
MHFWWSPADSVSHLESELTRAFPGRPLLRPAPGFVGVEAVDAACPPVMAFAAQTLPDASVLAIPSIRSVADVLVDRIVDGFPEDGPWRMHVVPCFGQGTAGEHRCALIQEAVIEGVRKRRRSRLRNRLTEPGPVAVNESWIQLLLVSPESGVFSVACAPAAHTWRSGLVPVPAGRIPVAVDKAAPSRAFAKLVESEIRLGERIQSGQTVVDLGACPGSWTYVAVRRGARVISVDRTELREDLMRNPGVMFHRGDAFTFEPPAPVDWLVCDVIAAPDRSMGLAIDWVRKGWARRFVVTIKFKGVEEYPKLDRLKAELAPLCSEFRLARLCANKNEACVMGSRQLPDSSSQNW